MEQNDVRARAIEAGKRAWSGLPYPARMDGDEILATVVDAVTPIIRADERRVAEVAWERMKASVEAEVREPLIEMIDDLVQQACYVPAEGMDEEYLDSMALSAYAEAMRFLAEEGRIKITSEYGRRVIAERVKNGGTE